MPAPKATNRGVQPAVGTYVTRKILVVDDSEDAATMLFDLLAMWGHQAKIALDGPSAIQTAHEWKPEIVLLDIGLPGMSGHAVARHLRQDSELNQITLVALTGYGQAQDRLDSAEAGFDHHLVKPVDLKQLEELLARC
jgi:CheY-like chemotaxis protein